VPLLVVVSPAKPLAGDSASVASGTTYTATAYAGLMLNDESANIHSDFWNSDSVRDRGVGGSNPLAPTKIFNRIGPPLTVMVS
jgi:hypothetical protein